MVDHIYNFSDPCQLCKELISGQSRISRKLAREEYLINLKQHLEKHDDRSFLLWPCDKCDTILVVWVKKDLQQPVVERAIISLGEVIEEHIEQYHKNKPRAKKRKVRK